MDQGPYLRWAKVYSGEEGDEKEREREMLNVSWVKKKLVGNAAKGNDVVSCLLVEARATKGGLVGWLARAWACFLFQLNTWTVPKFNPVYFGSRLGMGNKIHCLVSISLICFFMPFVMWIIWNRKDFSVHKIRIIRKYQYIKLSQLSFNRIFIKINNC